MLNIKIQRLSRNATLPRYATLHAAGMDLAACLEGPVEIVPFTTQLIPTGLVIELPPGFEAQLRPRSGLALKHLISLPNSPATIDADYRGEIKVILVNYGKKTFTVNHGDRIAQMVIARCEQVRLEEVDALSETERGDGGFGHTGVGADLSAPVTSDE